MGVRGTPVRTSGPTEIRLSLSRLEEFLARPELSGKVEFLACTPHSQQGDFAQQRESTRFRNPGLFLRRSVAGVIRRD